MPAPASQAPRTGGASSGAYLPPMPDMIRAPRGPDFVDRGQGQGPQIAAHQPRPPAVRTQSPEGPTPFRPSTSAGTAPLAPRSAKLELPPPEALGLLPSTAASLDWAAARSALEKCQARTYRLEKTASGSHRFLCTVPYADQPSRCREFVGEAASEAEAVQQVLAEIARWQAGRLTALAP